jgi:hypothetical protein
MRARFWVPVASAVVVIIVVVAVLALSLGGGAGKASASVLTEPTSSAHDPFAPPMGTDQPPTQPVQPPPNYQVAGGNVGLYGGTLDVSSCDKTKMIDFLQANPDKAAAWAGVLGMPTSQIPTYIDSLTPVILRSDTLVTNHGFVNGQATAFPAVLQAGTAVLVDDKGQPVTKCYCGNPLTTPPSYSSPPTYYGPHWTYWHDGNNYTTVTQNTTTINIFVLVDVQTGRTIYLPAGGSTPTATPPGGSNPTSSTTTTTAQPRRPSSSTTSSSTTSSSTTSTTANPCTGAYSDDPDTPSSGLTPGDPRYQDELAEESAGCS